MSIKYKLLFSLLFISITTLSLSIIVSNYIQTSSNKFFHEVAEKSLPGSIALARMSTEFYRIEFLLDIYENNDSAKVRNEIEIALAALGEYYTTHLLYHQDIDENNPISIIVENYTQLVTQYLLASNNKVERNQLNKLERQLQDMVEEFTYEFTPHIDRDIQNSYRESMSMQSVYKSINIIMWSYSVVVIVLIILMSFYFSNLISKPLHNFTRLIEKYGQGKPVVFEKDDKLPKEINELQNFLKFAIEQRNKAERKLSHQANYDALTDLPNRYLSEDRLNHLINEARRNKRIVAVMFIDLDDFKKFNDSLGHGFGDKFLKSIAKELKTNIRAEDTIGRLGGDEFIGIFGNLKSIVDAQPIAEAILSKFQQPFGVDDGFYSISTSIGISFYPNDGENTSELLKKADTAMYHSKISGKNIYTFHSEEMYSALKRRLELENNLVHALDNNELEIFFQPKYSTNPLQIEGFEALLRWHNAHLGHVSPDEFIPIAEQSGLITAIGKFVLKTALAFITQINKKFSKNYSIAVNLSPAQFRDTEFVNYIKQQLDTFNFCAELFEIEITENLLLQDNKTTFQMLEDINNLNIKIAMDDFGTGYSSLNYLRRFPFDVIKIDRSFVQDLENSKSDQELVSATILMAHALELKVVAEGVETEKQLEFLLNHQCDVIQGYYFSKPLPGNEVDIFITSNS